LAESLDRGMKGGGNLQLEHTSPGSGSCLPDPLPKELDEENVTTDIAGTAAQLKTATSSSRILNLSNRYEPR
jgi:hypothetical protein